MKKLGGKGLIHITDNVRNRPSFICNCCGCCCGLLAGVIRRNLSHAINPSPYIASVDEDLCEGCGLCSKKCQVFAIDVEDKVADIDDEKCLGCGVCVKACKFSAVSLKRRKKVPKVPRNKTMRYVKIANEKGRLFPLIRASFRSNMRGFFR